MRIFLIIFILFGSVAFEEAIACSASVGFTRFIPSQPDLQPPLESKTNMPKNFGGNPIDASTLSKNPELWQNKFVSSYYEILDVDYNIVRQSKKEPSYCPGNSFISFEIELDNKKDHDPESLGFYFQPLNSGQADYLFPHYPVQGMKLDNDRVKFTFKIIEQIPELEERISTDINIFVIDNSLRLGIPKNIKLLE